MTKASSLYHSTECVSRCGPPEQMMIQTRAGGQVGWSTKAWPKKTGLWNQGEGIEELWLQFHKTIKEPSNKLKEHQTCCYCCLISPWWLMTVQTKLPMIVIKPSSAPSLKSLNNILSKCVLTEQIPPKTESKVRTKTLLPEWAFFSSTPKKENVIKIRSAKSELSCFCSIRHFPWMWHNSFVKLQRPRNG